jgi:uncharacterized protein
MHSNKHLNRRSFVTQFSAASALAIAGCRSLPKTQEHQHQDLKPVLGPVAPLKEGWIIDTHIHVKPGNPNLKPDSPETAQLMSSPLEAICNRIEREMTAGRVGLAFAMGQVTGESSDPLGIEISLKAAQLLPAIRVVGIADPRKTSRAHLRAVEEEIVANRDKVAAFKAYLGYIHVAPEDERYEPYYALAAKHCLPFIFHTGDTWSTKGLLELSHPLRVDKVATRYPNVKFILAHFGVPWHLDAAEVIFKNDNVWADLSGLYVGDEKTLNEYLQNGSKADVLPGVIVADVKKALSYAARFDRFLYGSDWPIAAMSTYRRFAEAIIPPEHHEKVFRQNAIELFGVSV